MFCVEDRSFALPLQPLLREFGVANLAAIATGAHGAGLVQQMLQKDCNPLFLPDPAHTSLMSS